MPKPAHPGPAAVQVYWRPGCPFCALLRRGLRRSGLDCQEINIWDDPKAAAWVRSVNGGDETVPTVAVAGRSLTNPSVRQVLALVEREAPHLLPASAGRRRGLPRPWRRGTSGDS